MGYTILKFRLYGGHFIVGRQFELAIGKLENRIGAPFHRVLCTTPRLSAATPLVSEQNLGARIVEGGRMPEGIMRIADSINTDRMRRIVNIQQDSISRTRTGG